MALICKYCKKTVTLNFNLTPLFQLHEVISVCYNHPQLVYSHRAVLHTLLVRVNVTIVYLYYRVIILLPNDLINFTFYNYGAHL